MQAAGLELNVCVLVFDYIILLCGCVSGSILCFFASCVDIIIPVLLSCLVL